MKLASLKNGGRDGSLVVVSSDNRRWLSAGQIAPTLQSALDDWNRAEPQLRIIAARADSGEGDAVDVSQCTAPLPRAWQWLDGSAFPTHGLLMQRAFGLPPIETDKPLMYQGMSHQFLGATDDVPFVSEVDGIDFEGEFGIITDAVPMGTSAQEASDLVRLLVLINDWSLRTIAPVEMKTGFGWVQAKPACSVAPFAITPDELGNAWINSRVHLPLTVEVNGDWFGNPEGHAMQFGFDDLISHAARTRFLPAGTIIGSGTVSNTDHERVGSSCISERRAIETIESGTPRTSFLSFGDRITMRAEREGLSVFGCLDQLVTKGER